MRYGLPYKGSKNKIAEWVVDQLPSADVFVDLFCGGGAITHRALMSGKYKRFMMNDIDQRLPQLFVDSANGKYTTDNRTEFVTREQFEQQKENDAYIALVWSFANNGMDYMYSKELEPFKKAMHNAVFFNDLEPLKALGHELDRIDTDDKEARYREYSAQLMNTKHNLLESYTRLLNFERLKRIEEISGANEIEISGGDYQSVRIPDSAVVYCDIPYIGTDCGMYGGFDHGRFYEWAQLQRNIFISEYTMPDDFVLIAECEKQILSSAVGNANRAVERIYTNKITFEQMPDTAKDAIKYNLFEQMSFI